MALTAAQVDELRDRIRDALGDIPVQQADLTYARGQISPTFALPVWTVGFTSEDPAVKTLVNSVQWSSVTLMNHVNTVVMNATVLAGIRDWNQRKQDAPGHYHALKSARRIVEATRKDLERANYIRTLMTHVYTGASAAEVHELAEMLDPLVSKVLGDLGEWLTSLGI